MQNKRHIIHDHLTNWGLKSFKDSDKYFQWVAQIFKENNVSEDKINNFVDLQQRMGVGLDNEKKLFYKFIAEEEIFLNITHSIKFNALVENGLNIINSIEGETGTILDLGCNIGYLTSFYANYFENHYLVGFDTCKDSIKKANKYNNKRKNFEFCDTYKQLEEHKFDYIIDTQCLCTIKDYHSLNQNLINLKKLINENGSFISISTLATIEEAKQFIELFKQNGLIVNMFKPVFIDGFEGKEAYTKILFKKNKQEFKINFENYFNTVIKKLNSF